MVDFSSLPALPPAPPTDLATRALPTHVIAAGTIFYRIHRTATRPLYFDPRSRVESRGRWDAPSDEFGIAYFADHPRLAFAETLLRNLELDEIASATLTSRALVEIEVVRELRLVKMHGEGLRRLRATGAVVQGPYTNTWAWSQALYGHPETPDGIRYRARRDDDLFAIALYDRAASTLVPQTSTGLLDPALARDLGSWLDHYGIGLGP